MSAADNSRKAPVERREYFRIEDEVSLHYRVVSGQEAEIVEKQLFDQLPHRFTAASSFAATARHMDGLLRQIQGDSPVLARYLDAVDRKLNMLAQLFVIEEMQVHEEPSRQVSLSAGGVAFYTRSPLTVDDTLELKMVLFPSFTGILTIGRVVSCESHVGEDKDFPFRIALEFSCLRENDRDLLVKHVLCKQSEQLRKRRDQLNED